MAEKVQSDDALDALVGDMRAVASKLRASLKRLHEKYAPLTEGKLADYIPELTKTNPESFGVAVTTVTGRTYAVGDCEQTFTIQSVSKPFMYGLALEDHGREEVMKRVGVEPTGDAFNSMLKLEQADARPFNPMINAGAIAVASLIKGTDEPDRLNRVLNMFAAYIGKPPSMDTAVFTSERATGHRNRAIAYFLLNGGILVNPLDESLDLYFKQCSLLVTARDLSMMGAALANGGVNPITGKPAVQPQYVRDMLSVMSTCGMYDYSGEWYYRVGLAAKSGVGGGICAVVPGVAGIGVFSPRLDSRGNSVRGVKALIDLSEEYDLHVFGGTGNYDKFAAACGTRHSTA